MNNEHEKNKSINRTNVEGQYFFCTLIKTNTVQLRCVVGWKIGECGNGRGVRGGGGVTGGKEKGRGGAENMKEMKMKNVKD